MNENLTPQIVAALLQDGTIKMTGEEIATAIADAVGGLEKQYRFLGVATPELAPGNIQTPTLYVAVMDATYPSFSGQSVDNGQIAFFTSDDGAYWDMALAYNPQPEPGPGPSPTPGGGNMVALSTEAGWPYIEAEDAVPPAEFAQLVGATEADIMKLINFEAIGFWIKPSDPSIAPEWMGGRVPAIRDQGVENDGGDVTVAYTGPFEFVSWPDIGISARSVYLVITPAGKIYTAYDI